MAYRRRQQAVARSSTLEEDVGNPRHPPPPTHHVGLDGENDGLSELENDADVISNSSSSSSSLAAKAIKASSAHRDSSISSAYAAAAHSASPSSNLNPNATSTYSYISSSSSQDSKPYEYTSMKNLSESKHGFWGVLARKAKAIIDDDNSGQQYETFGRPREQKFGTDIRGKFNDSGISDERQQKIEGSTIKKGLGAIASSLNYIGGTIGNALEESLTRVENRTSDIVQETRKHIRKKPGSSMEQNQSLNRGSKLQQQMQTDQELQLKASRDVAMAMAAKAKLLLRELKTVKADLAFAKERCAQLEEENKILRENRERGDNLEDDDLIRLQLETLLAEKARLAHENSVYARENRFLREVVEYHQLTMQDVVYLDEGTEEVTEVYPIKVTSASDLYTISTSPAPPEGGVDISQTNQANQLMPSFPGLDRSSQMTQVIPTCPLLSSDLREK